MREIDRLTIDVIVDNTTDMLSSRPAYFTPELRVLLEAGLQEMAGEALCSAHHGLCLALSAHLDDRRRHLLFDAGPDPYALQRNGHHMNIDFGAIEAIVLSHGHFDHAEGLLQAVTLIRTANSGRTLPLHVHPGAFVRRAVKLPSGELLPLQEVPSRAALTDAGLRLVESDQPEELLDGTFALSGEIPRHSFERGLQTQVRQTAAGEWEPDPLVLDERFLVANIRGKGLAILTGCSHAGVINICAHARELYPGVPLYALIGGLHLVYPNEDLIGKTVAALQELGLQIIVPGHCTGWRAVHALAAAFGEAVVTPLAAGSRITI